MPEQWLFSPMRLRGHRERVGWSRNQLGAKISRGGPTIKAYEYGLTKPSLDVFLLLCGSLGISPNDLCRTSLDDETEHSMGKDWENSER